MEQCIMNTDGLNALVNQLGCDFDGTFVVTDETPDAIDEIQRLLLTENSNFRTTRRQLALSNVIEKSLLPLILHVCEDNDEEDDDENDSCLTEDEKQTIYSKAVNLLMSLTLPLECLSPSAGKYRTQYSIPERVREDVSNLYITAKLAFLDFRICSAVLGMCKKLTEPLHKGKELEPHSCQALNNTILLLRNILFLPDTQRSSYEPDTHISILRLLFKGGLSDIILDLLSSNQHQFWCVSTVQLIFLLYKDQKFIRKDFVYDVTSSCCQSVRSSVGWCSEGSFLWCSNDTCSDETANKMESASQYSNDSTLKGSDDGDEIKDDDSGESSQDGIYPPHNSENSHELPSGLVPERLLDLEKSVSCKLIYWQISEELQSLTESLLHKGFSNLIIGLKTIHIADESDGLSSLYFMWAIAHFLRLARQLRAPFSVFGACFTVDVVGYITYLGVSSTEEIIVNRARNSDVKLACRSNKLVVKALFEIFTAIGYIDRKQLATEERHHLNSLLGHMICLKDLRQIFLLFLRHLTVETVGVQHVSDIACANHQYLMVAENVLAGSDPPPFSMLSHVKSFATFPIMSQYGDLLSQYEENSSEVNDCVLTLMHHIAGDCNSYEVLLQFPIIRKMAEIASYSSLSEEFQELAHFLMQQFTILANNDPFQCSQYLFAGSNDEERMDETGELNEWTDEEIDVLFQLHTEHSTSENMVESIGNGLQENNIFKSREEIITKLCSYGLVSEQEINKLNSKQELTGMGKCLSKMPLTTLTYLPDSIDDCIECLNKRDQGHHLTWVQNILLELCSIKLGGRSLSNCQLAEDPVPLYYALQGKSIPFVAYTQDQEDFIRDEYFIQLLKLMGFHQAEDSGQFFPRIPHFWTPEDLLFKAQQLGPVDLEKQKFTMEDVEANANWWMKNMAPQTTTDIGCFNEGMDHQGNRPGELWHIFVKQCNISPHLRSLKKQLQDAE